MSYHSPKLREEARNAWVSGEYATLQAVANALGLQRDTVYRWRQRYNWDDERQRLLAESRKKSESQLVAAISRARLEHQIIWRAIDAEISRRIVEHRQRGENIPLDELDTMARIMEKAQRGMYLTGAEEVTIEEREQIFAVSYAGLQDAIDAAREESAARNGGNGAQQIEAPEDEEE
jgi:uncharacterized protein YjcR